MDLIKHKKLFITLSASLVALSIVSILVFGFRPGIDFVGGTLWQIQFQTGEIGDRALQEFFSKEDFENVLVRRGETNQNFFISLKELSEEEHLRLADSLINEFGEMEELSFSSIGPAIGQELRKKVIIAFILVLLGISLYVTYAFRKVSYPVSSWKYGLITLLTLFHDVIIAAGIFAFLGWWQVIEVDINLVVAMLVIMGFSVHDTIVVFDRTRENLLLADMPERSWFAPGGKERLETLVNTSVNQTIARSINTSLTLIVVLLALIFLGAPSMIYFTLLILIGTIIGTYSSIFLASPLLTYFYRKS